jgi:hypothetical protein
MPKYKITMENRSTNASGAVTIFEEKADVKVAYDAAIEGATYIFGPLAQDSLRCITIIEQPEV